jgi:hypothetical protein
VSLPDHLLEPDDEGLETGECAGDPYTYPCEACWILWNEIKADREYDEGKEAA